ncbi:MAG: DUF3105 domain-containing protein [Chloroflexota bacterium]|nr:DUF3105 domain-containing protein [Chloroflexota bacterium]
MPTRRERMQQEEERARRQQQQRVLLIGGGIVAAVVVIGLIVMASGALNPSAATIQPVAQVAGTVSCGAVQDFPVQSRDHIKPNQPHPDYSSNPPTSGWHWDTPQDWGIHTTPQFQEQLVHNLEHGGIVVQYNNLSSADTQRLTNLVQRDTYHMILAPYPGLPSGVQVAMTAWTHLQTCTGVNENAIHAFINAYRDKGPELVP